MNDKAIKYIDEQTRKGFGHFQYLYLPLMNSAFYQRIRDDARFEDIAEKQKKKYEERLKKYGKF